MPHPFVVSLMLLASASAASAPIPAGRANRIEIAQVTIRGQIIVRVPSALQAGPVRSPNNVQPRWVEKSGPKCIEADKMGGAIVDGNQIDLVMRGGDRIRAKLDGDCAGLGFYGGFYLKPSADGKVCAGRDTIRTRVGGICTIRRFHRLVAKR